MSINQFSAVDCCRSRTLSMNQNRVIKRQRFDWILCKPNEVNEKSDLPYEARKTDWLRFSCSFKILNEHLYKPHEAKEWKQQKYFLLIIFIKIFGHSLFIWNQYRQRLRNFRVITLMLDKKYNIIQLSPCLFIHHQFTLLFSNDFDIH